MSSYGSIAAMQRIAAAFERIAAAQERNADNFAFVINELRPLLTAAKQEIEARKNEK